MICQQCNQRPATLHYTKIINGQKEEFNLCESCAQEKGEMFMSNNSSDFIINNLLSGLFNIEPKFQQTKQNPFQKREIIQCENCAMTFQQFIKAGKFGCSHCYTSFQVQLKPIYKRLHGGNWSHQGKIPKRIGGSMHIRKNIEELKAQLQYLIENEEFEKAANVRDEIRLLNEKLDETDGGGK